MNPYITNYHGFSGSTQHTFIISQLLWVRSLGRAELVPLLRISKDCNQGVVRVVFSFEGLIREGATSKLTQLMTEFIFCDRATEKASPFC